MSCFTSTPAVSFAHEAGVRGWRGERIKPDPERSFVDRRDRAGACVTTYWRARYIFIIAALSSTASPVTSTSAFLTVPEKANGGL